MKSMIRLHFHLAFPYCKETKQNPGDIMGYNWGYSGLMLNTLEP